MERISLRYSPETRQRIGKKFGFRSRENRIRESLAAAIGFMRIRPLRDRCATYGCALPYLSSAKLPDRAALSSTYDRCHGRLMLPRHLVRVEGELKDRPHCFGR